MCYILYSVRSSSSRAPPHPQMEGGFNFAAPSGLKKSSTSSNLAGGDSGGFSFGAPSAAPADVGGFSFGAPAAPAAPADLGTGAAVAPAAVEAGGFSFGGASAATPSAPAATPAAPAATPAAPAATPAAPAAAPADLGGGGFQFADPPAAPTAAATTPAAPAAAPAPSAPADQGGGFQFANTAASASTPAPAAAAKVATSAPLAVSVTPAPVAAGAAPDTAGRKSVSFDPATGGGANSGANASPAGAGAAAPTAASELAAAAATGAISPDLQTKPLAEIAHDWTRRLKAHESEFQEAAREVKEWDDFLLTMQMEVNNLSKHTAQQAKQLQELDSGLESMKGYHDSLEHQLRATEITVSDKLRYHDGTGEATAADYERNRNYSLAEEVAAQVSRLTEDLAEMVKKLNAAHAGNVRAASEFAQIEQIVDVHQRSLEFIDQRATEIAQGLEGTQAAVRQATARP